MQTDTFTFELEAPFANASAHMLRHIAAERTTRDVPGSGLLIRDGI